MYRALNCVICQIVIQKTNLCKKFMKVDRITFIGRECLNKTPIEFVGLVQFSSYN